jgi:hypothetical protein
MAGQALPSNLDNTSISDLCEILATQDPEQLQASLQALRTHFPYLPPFQTMMAPYGTNTVLPPLRPQDGFWSFQGTTAAAANFNGTVVLTAAQVDNGQPSNVLNRGIILGMVLTVAAGAAAQPPLDLGISDGVTTAHFLAAAPANGSCVVAPTGLLFFGAPGTGISLTQGAAAANTVQGLVLWGVRQPLGLLP